MSEIPVLKNKDRSNRHRNVILRIAIFSALLVIMGEGGGTKNFKGGTIQSKPRESYRAKTKFNFGNLGSLFSCISILQLGKVLKKYSQ